MGLCIPEGESIRTEKHGLAAGGRSRWLADHNFDQHKGSRESE